MAQTDIGRTATHDGNLTVLVGMESDWSVAEVLAALPDDVEPIEGHQNVVLNYVMVRLPTDDASVGRDMVNEMEQAEGVTYVEWTPVYKHPYIGDAPRNGTAPLGGFPDSVRSGLRSVTDIARDVQRFIGRLFGDDTETGDPRFSEQYAPQQVGAPEARAMLPDDPEYTPTLAVIDTGVDYTHPDLRGQFGEFKGRDFGDGDDDPAPDFGLVSDHGSHVAGIAGLSDTRLLSAKIFGANGSALGTTVAEAIQWAADNGADVINMSIGGTGGAGLPSETVRRAIQYAEDNGTLCVAATGNSGESPVQYPAKHPNVFGVTATNSDGQVASFPNFGEDADITGPGVDVLSTVPPYKGISPIGLYYAGKSGTSMSSPAVCGVALLGLYAAEGDTSPAELRAAIRRTAEEIPDTPAEKQGAGIARADQLVDDLS